MNQGIVSGLAIGFLLLAGSTGATPLEDAGIEHAAAPFVAAPRAHLHAEGMEPSGHPAEGESASSPGCADPEGVWLLPDGLTLGGPEDNTDVSPYKEWVEACGLAVSYLDLKVVVPYEEVLSDYEACMAANAEAAFQRILASPGEGTLHLSDPLTAGDDWSCGSPLVPPADGALDYELTLPAIHLGQVGGSIQFTLYSYEAKNEDNRAGAINVIFWGNGQLAQAKSLLYTSSHWKSTEHHGFRCGADRYAYIWDAMHGGADKWFTSTTQSEAHHSNDGFYHCDNAREHIRHYGDSTLVDTHSPSWSKYSIANVHHDDHNHDNPNSEDGKAHLTADMSAIGYSHGQVWNSAAGIYMHTWRI